MVREGLCPAGEPPVLYGTVTMALGTLAHRANLDLLEAAYQRWRLDPATVDESWRTFFEGFELGLGSARPSAADHAQTGVVRLIYAYRDLGHFLARLDPLTEPLK